MRTYLGLFLVLWVGVALAGEGDNEGVVYQYGNPEAKKVGNALGEFLVDIYVSLEEYLQGLSNTCSAAVSLQEYNNALIKSKDAGCATESPEGYEDADKTIADAADVCKEVETVDDLVIFIVEVEKSQTRVEKLDQLLSKNTEACSSKKVSESTCESNKARIVSQLEDILSKKETARFQHLLRNAYFNTKKIVDTCMDNYTENLKRELDKATKSIKDCLDNK